MRVLDTERWVAVECEPDKKDGQVRVFHRSSSKPLFEGNWIVFDIWLSNRDFAFRNGFHYDNNWPDFYRDRRNLDFLGEFKKEYMDGLNTAQGLAREMER